MRILHITPHLGGGIGKVISGLCINDRNNQHSILCLEKPINFHFFDICVKKEINIFFNDKSNKIEEYVLNSDIVQIEWWHHPLTVEFMCKYLNKIKTRLLVWSHISGCNFPYIPINFIKFADTFVFATPYSFDNPFYTEKEKQYAKRTAKLVVSSGNDFHSVPKAKVPHEGFNVGYVGFLGYEKTRPNFVKICEQCASLENIKFIILGDLTYGNHLIEDIKQSKFANQFILKGYSKNIAEELAEFDVFACLLNKEHTGASENALLEAMHASVCPIVFKQCTEQYLVNNQVTGIVCDGDQEFIEAIYTLYHDERKRDLLGKEASDFVSSNLSIQNTVSKMANEYLDLMKSEKKYHDASSIFGYSPKEWFLSCYKGDIEKIKGLAAGESKGSVKQYYRYFKDKELEIIMKENNLWI